MLQPLAGAPLFAQKWRPLFQKNALTQVLTQVFVERPADLFHPPKREDDR